KHVDHTHPDSIIGLCCADNGRQLADEIFGDRYVWVPYIRPGFKLSKMIAEGVKNNPKAELVVMEKHGRVNWGETSEEAYNKTIEVINEAAKYIEDRVNEETLFGGAKYQALPAEDRREIAAQVMPIIRGAVSDEKHMILSFDDADDVLKFVNGKDSPEL